MTAPNMTATKTEAATTKDEGRYVPYSCLCALLRRFEVKEIGRDKATMRPIVDTTQADLDEIESNADMAAFSLAEGIAVIGQCLIEGGAKEMGPNGIRTVGDLLVTLGEAIGATMQIAEQAREAMPGRTT